MNIETVTINKVDSYALEQLVEKTYGFQWSFQADQLAGNDTTHEFDVTGEPDEDYLKEWLEVKGMVEYRADDVLNDLARKQLIPTGKYLVNLSY